VLQFSLNLPQECCSSGALACGEQAGAEAIAESSQQPRRNFAYRLRSEELSRAVAALKQHPMQLKMRLIHTASVLWHPAESAGSAGSALSFMSCIGNAKLIS
jgi:hypothetical protein